MDKLTESPLPSDIYTLQPHYRSGTSSIGAAFFVPCLTHCTRYRRAVGYFSSTALLTWAESLSNLINRHGVRVLLLISPSLSDEDREALSRALDDNERAALRSKLASDFVSAILSEMSSDQLTVWRLELLTWMIANDRLELRFAFPKTTTRFSIFHEKIGVFDFNGGHRVAFTGSANETRYGYAENYESIDVYRSWVASDEARVQTKVDQFTEAWRGDADGLVVEELSREVLNEIWIVAPGEPPSSIRPTTVHERASRDYSTSASEASHKWRHQEEAVEAFIAARRGILEMATGTGKTRTALKILEQLLDRDEVDSAIVATDGTDLLDQWRTTLDAWSLRRGGNFRVLRHYSSFHEIGSFARSPEKAVLIVSRQQLSKLFDRLTHDERSRMLIVHDEVHGLGAASHIKKLAGEHSPFSYVLGLTATPDREYDAEGTAFIEQEVGGIVYEFGIKQAIQRGILCEFDYRALDFDLTDTDIQRIQAIFARKRIAQEEGRPISDEEIYREIAMVYKTAEMKPLVFDDFIHKNPEILHSTIIFVATKSFGQPLLRSIHPLTHNYRTYYGDDDRGNLVKFSQGEIDCLITCHRISQGIDVRGLKHVILVSSDRSKLETIQRIGRCLRTDPSDPDKRAKVVDFVGVKSRVGEIEFVDADRSRMEWLQGLAKTRRQ